LQKVADKKTASLACKVVFFYDGARAERHFVIVFIGVGMGFAYKNWRELFSVQYFFSRRLILDENQADAIHICRSLPLSG
jgi:hypothetical protein